MRVFQANDYNVGDQLPTPIIRHVLKVPVEVVGKKDRRKLMVIGSELHKARRGDVVWGQGIRRTTHKKLKKVRVLAVRGKLCHEYISGVHIPRVYGDPALLMPLIYKPKSREKVHEIGIIPHFSDEADGTYPEGHLISTSLPWKRFVQEIVSCELIISSSLHGLILAEAYGVPAEWAVWGRTEKWKIKYQDYLTGTDRPVQEPGPLPRLGRRRLKRIQDRLIKALMRYYANHRPG